MERINGGTGRAVPNLAKIADPRERKAYQTYLDCYARISDGEPMTYDEWREHSIRLFNGVRPPVASDLDE